VFTFSFQAKVTSSNFDSLIPENEGRLRGDGEVATAAGIKSIGLNSGFTSTPPFGWLQTKTSSVSLKLPVVNTQNVNFFLNTQKNENYQTAVQVETAILLVEWEFAHVQTAVNSQH